jgi:hypothetical protein
MDELLIPFGKDKTTDAIVEPEDAARGRACNCYCPECKVSLVSRHPSDEESRKHFAHDPRDKKYNPKRKCPLHGAASVALMIRHLSERIINEAIRTPAFEIRTGMKCCNTSIPVPITSEQTNIITNARPSHTLNGNSPDLIITVKDHEIAVELKYATRGSKFKRHSTSSHTAVLFIDCNKFELQKAHNGNQRRFSDQALEFFLSVDAKRWFSHPRELKARTRARSTHVASCPKLVHNSQLEIVVKHCDHCGEEWKQRPGEPDSCPECFHVKL